MNDAWDRILTSLQTCLQPGLFQLWIKPLRGHLDHNTLVLRAPNEFVCTWVRTRMLEQIAAAARDTLGFAPQIDLGHLTLPPLEASSALPVDLSRPTLARMPQQRVQSHEMVLPMEQGLVTRSVQRWRHEFNDFIVGPCNQLAYVASQSFCQDARGTDQLFLCSAPGLGKTHLAQAIGAELARQTNRSHLRVCYLSGEEFASQLVMAIKARTVEQFKARFRNNVDLLMLEDVHFFQGKEKMQDELLNTLKSLQNQGRRVVMTSTFLPRELSDMDPHLASRFTQGFMAVIDKPDYQTRLGIINAKARASQVKVPMSVAELLAERIKTDVRQLESCLKNLMLKAQLLNMDISLDLAWEVLQNYKLDHSVLDLDQIISFICQAYGFALDELASKSRKKDRVIARNTAFYLARQHTELSLAEIGRRFNRRHSTVIKGIASIERELSRQSALGRQLSRTIEQARA